MPQLLSKMGVAAGALFLCAAFAAANAEQSFGVPGVSPVVPVENTFNLPAEEPDAQRLWTDQGLFDKNDDPSAGVAPASENPEIPALQDEFPFTNWPPSMRK
jgi:hypothetical protein